MKLIFAAVSAAAIVAATVPIAVSSASAQTQISVEREKAIMACTAAVKRTRSSRSDDQNARVAAYKACMTKLGQLP